jgi:O-antigen ligase
MAARARLAIADRLPRSTLVTTAVIILLAAMTGLATAKLGSLQHQLKALLIVVAGLTMAVAALRPELGLVILLALSPFEFPFYGTNSNQLLLLSLALVLAWRIRTRAIPAWAAVGGLALLAGSLIADLGAHNQAVALEGTLNWLSAIVVLFVAFSVLRQRQDASRRLVDIFIGSSVIVVAFGFLQKAGVHAIVGPPFNVGHPNSFFSYYTVYAGYLAMAATLATGEILVALDERRIVRAGTLAAVLMLMLAGLTAATSRGGLLALAGGWLLLLVLNVRRGSVLSRMIVVLAIFAVAGYAVTPHSTLVTIERRFATSNGALGEDKTRFALQRAGEQALVTHPFGLGYGNFRYYLSSNVRSSNIHQPFFHAQETPVQIGLDAGWIGLVGFVALFAWPILLVFRHPQGGPSAVRASAFAAALGGFMAQGLYDYVLWDLPFVIFFLAMIWGVEHSLLVDRQSGATAVGRTAGRSRRLPGRAALRRPFLPRSISGE